MIVLKAFPLEFEGVGQARQAAHGRAGAAQEQNQK
jgi:hypothetical protein